MQGKGLREGSRAGEEEINYANKRVSQCTCRLVIGRRSVSAFSEGWRTLQTAFPGVSTSIDTAVTSQQQPLKRGRGFSTRCVNVTALFGGARPAKLFVL